MRRGNGAVLAGVFCTVGLAATASAETRYVKLDNPTPVYPYTSWATAATSIQDAVDACAAGDTVFVTNGVYETGSRVTPGGLLQNRLVITGDILVKSVDGFAVTVIKGQGPQGPGAVRCVYMEAGTLDGFTLTGGHTRTTDETSTDGYGGGAAMLGGTLRNCALTDNSACIGGGACALGTLYNCLLARNTAGVAGGACGFSTLHNCTVADNTAGEQAGGAYDCAMKNCIVYDNDAPFAPNHVYGSLNYCWRTSPRQSSCRPSRPSPGRTASTSAPATRRRWSISQRTRPSTRSSCLRGSTGRSTSAWT